MASAPVGAEPAGAALDGATAAGSRSPLGQLLTSRTRAPITVRARRGRIGIRPSVRNAAASAGRATFADSPPGEGILAKGGGIMVDRIADIWGPRTPHAQGTPWPARVDQHLAPGLTDADVDRWVQSACVL